MRHGKCQDLYVLSEVVLLLVVVMDVGCVGVGVCVGGGVVVGGGCCSSSCAIGAMSNCLITTTC